MTHKRHTADRLCAAALYISQALSPLLQHETSNTRLLQTRTRRNFTPSRCKEPLSAPSLLLGAPPRVFFLAARVTLLTQAQALRNRALQSSLSHKAITPRRAANFWLEIRSAVYTEEEYTIQIYAAAHRVHEEGEMAIPVTSFGSLSYCARASVCVVGIVGIDRCERLPRITTNNKTRLA